MSLLDDALRKRQQEIEKPNVTSHILGFQEDGEVEKSQPKKLFLIILGILAIFSAGLSFAILKYNNNQIKPKVFSINNSNTTKHTILAKKEASFSIPESDPKAVNKESEIIEKNTPSIKPTDTKKTIEIETTAPSQPKGAKKAPTINHLSNVVPKLEARIKKKIPQSHQKKDINIAHVSESLKKTKSVAVAKIRKPNNMNPFLVTAARYQRDGRIKEAITIYKKILAKHPKDRKARLNLAAAYLQFGQITAATPLLKELYLEYPNDPKILLNYAIILTKTGKYQEALFCLSQAETKGGPNFEILLNKGIVLRRLGKLKEAIRAYEEASSLRHNDPRLLFNQAIVFDTAGSYQKAIFYYKSYLENPEHNRRKDNLVRDRLQQLYAYLNNKRKEYSSD